MSRASLLLVVALGAMRDPCGTDTSLVGENAPCTRSSDCDKMLTCVDGVCSPPDGGAMDAGGDADGAGLKDGDGSD